MRTEKRDASIKGNQWCDDEYSMKEIKHGQKFFKNLFWNHKYYTLIYFISKKTKLEIYFTFLISPPLKYPFCNVCLSGNQATFSCVMECEGRKMLKRLSSLSPIPTLAECPLSCQPMWTETRFPTASAKHGHIEEALPARFWDYAVNSEDLKRKEWHI